MRFKKLKQAILVESIYGKFNMSKGSRSRPFSVSQKQFGNNYDAIFRKPDPRILEEAQREDEEFEAIAKRSQSDVKDSDRGG